MMIRARYTKTGSLVHLSHLDLVRLFERAFRRAAVPLAFTQGFNPHPMIAFAAPLSVGVGSVGEYVDVVLSDLMEPLVFLKAMNQTLPPEIQITGAALKDEKTTPSLMQEAALMDYELTFSLVGPSARENLQSAIDRFLSQEQVMVEKKAKPPKGKKRSGKQAKSRSVDILPLVYAFRIINRMDERVTLFLSIKVFDQATVKPGLIFEKWIEDAGLTLTPGSLEVLRKEIYKQNSQGEYVSLMD